MAINQFCSCQYKMANQVGVEMAEVIPGFATRFEIPDLVACFASWPLFVLSATEDIFSFDADQVVGAAKVLNPDVRLEHKRYQGGYALTQEGFDDVVNLLFVRME